MNTLKYLVCLLVLLSANSNSFADETYLDPFFNENYSPNNCEKLEVHDFSSGFNFIVNKDFKIKNIYEFQSLGFRKIYNENSDSTVMCVSHKSDDEHYYLVKFQWNENKSKLKSVESSWNINLNITIDPFEKPDVFGSILKDYVEKYKNGTKLKLISEPTKEELDNFPKSNDQIDFIFKTECEGTEITIKWKLYASILNKSKIATIYQFVYLKDIEDTKKNQLNEKERLASIAKKRKSLTKTEKTELTIEFTQLKMEVKKLNLEIAVDNDLHKEKAQYYADNHLSKKLSSTANKQFLATLDEIGTRITKNTFRIKFNEKRMKEIQELMPELK